MKQDGNQKAAPLYDPRFEHDACGIGAVVDIQGRPSHQTVDDALKIVEKLEHRAGRDAEGQTGDGVGILLQISHTFFQKAAAGLGFALGDARDYGVGMFFFPQDALRRGQAKKMFELIVEKEGMEFLGWRAVPVVPDILGRKALAKMPRIEQAFVKRPAGVCRGLAFDRRLYVARRVFEQSSGDAYAVSLSSRTIVYKGMLLVDQLRRFYPDLQDPDYASAIALVHSRFSTNTNPSWERAHPNRFILHNGEINTIQGNVDRMLAREETMHAPVWAHGMDKVLPVVNVSGSDSAMLDNTLEFLVMSGMELPLAVMICIPEPWRNNESLSRARISVKLVSEAGVGTVAAGVAKAGAQVVLISGYDGGTGAAPRTSIHHAGLPWELGLAEAHQTLIQNGLRSRVVLETDGKLMSGRDVAIACMLGAEEFGFATAPLVAMGCVMMRVCSLDTCPVGVATQNPELRRRFRGKPEYVVNFMRFIAQELREHMARLGVRTVEELVGRTDLLRAREHAVNERAATADLSAILGNPCVGEGYKTHFNPADAYDFHLERTVDQSVLLAKMGSALKKGQKKQLALNVTSTDRAVGTMFGSEITRLHGQGLAEDTFTVRCTGGGGQSFGAFLPKGLTMVLEGDSNDCFGKGLSGGKLVVYPPKNAGYRAEDNIITGNAALYGATSGKAFIRGMAGERFCVRNSGAVSVVEGVGDHGCEYMTGGRVVVLGPTGKNFAAGMSGGIAYVWDPQRTLYLRVNKALVSIEPVQAKDDLEELRCLITQHVEATGSERGKAILADFAHSAASFKKILPRDYDRILRAIARLEGRGLDRDEVEIEAFYAVTRGGKR